MKILSADVQPVSELLQSALKDKQWLAYDSRLENVQANDIYLFDNRQDANDHKKEMRESGIEQTVLPVKPAFEAIEKSFELDSVVQRPVRSVELDHQLLYDEQASFEFFYTIDHIEEMLESFDWSKTFYDPLEANVETESWEDIQEFERLDWLIRQLKEVYKENPDMRPAIELMLNRYWKDQPMEVQIQSIISLDNEPGDGLNLVNEPQQILNDKSNSMNTENFQFLKDNLKYMGFGDKQHETLEQNLKEGKESFEMLFQAEVNKKPFEAVLHFGKSKEQDRYFFNNYDATLERNNGEKMQQTFYINKGRGVTAKEAYNLLEGRAVHKELTNKAGVEYKAWIQLDFDNKDKHGNNEVKQFHENYGYDLKEALDKYAIKELDAGDNEKKLMQSLQRGNIQSVTIGDNKMFVEANPQFKSVHLYDSSMKRVMKENIEQYQSKGEKPKVNKPVQDQKNDSLMPKKRTRQKKGLGI